MKHARWGHNKCNTDKETQTGQGRSQNDKKEAKESKTSEPKNKTAQQPKRKKKKQLNRQKNPKKANTESSLPKKLSTQREKHNERQNFPEQQLNRSAIGKSSGKRLEIKLKLKS